jgi:putative peptidoglycan lipid II flippase
MSRTILKSTSVVGAMTLISRITGMFRDMVYAQHFAAGPMLDAFLVAYKIPNFLRRLFAEGSFSQSFVPVISEYRVKRTPLEVRALVGGVSGSLGVVVFGVTLVGVIGAPLIIYAFAPGFTDNAGEYALAVSMLRWTFPYLFFISLTALFSGVLNSYSRFVVPAITQVIMNLVMIFFALVIASHSRSPGLSLAVGVFVSGLLQLLFQLPAVAALRLLEWPKWRPAAEGVRRIGRLMLPGILGSSAAQVSLLLDTFIASFLVTGSISWLYFADRLMEFPLGVFSIALATVILPGLAQHHANESTDQFSATLDWAIRLVILLASPAAVALLVLAGPLTATIYGYGKFDVHSIVMGSYALMAYSWGLLGFSLVKVLAPGYFARQDTRTPVRIALIALGVTMLLNLVVVMPAKWLGFPAPHALLATSTCVGAAVNTVLLWRGLRRAGVYRPAPAFWSVVLRIALANGVMAAVLLWLAGDTASWIATTPWWHRAERLALCVAVGAAVYFAAIFGVGLRYGDFRTRPPPRAPAGAA